MAGDDFDFAEGLAEADDGVGGFGKGELLACRGRGWLVGVSGMCIGFERDGILRRRGGGERVFFFRTLHRNRRATVSERKWGG